MSAWLIRRLRTVLAALLAASLVALAPAAGADPVVECQFPPGVWVFVAIDAPVTVCSTGTGPTNSNSVNVPILPIDPHYGN